jgi:glycosyltransferase involved in cell wall biosynthesis
LARVRRLGGHAHHHARPIGRDGTGSTQFSPRFGRSAIPAGLNVAVLIPCYNEELAVARVIGGFRASLPDAAIYVYDNNSRDGTADVARAAGAVVRREGRQGKGNVVRRMFADVEADVYVLVDGDATYDPIAAPEMVRQLVDEQLDMITAARDTDTDGAYRPMHRFGNAAFSGIVHWIFGNGVSDVLSGYRVLSRRFVKSFPALTSGFETETELTVHALELKMPIGEVATRYRERPAGSESKLRTWSDGMRILRAIVGLLKEERPLQFFALAALLLFIAGIAFGTPVITEYLRTGLVPRLPTAVLATGLVLLSFLSLVCGLVLDSVAHARREIKRIAYLALAPVTVAGEARGQDSAAMQSALPQERTVSTRGGGTVSSNELT